MKKFRITKARETDMPVENDLRGLGDTTIFNDLTPEPHLSISAKPIKLDELAKDLSIAESKKFSSPYAAHYICINNSLTHKEKAVNLFVFALMLKVNNGVNSVLWEENRFHKALQSGFEIKSTKEDKPQILNEDNKSIIISSSIQHYLEQSGFNIYPSTEHLHISHNESVSLLKSILNKSTSTEKTRNTPTTKAS